MESKMPKKVALIVKHIVSAVNSDKEMVNRLGIRQRLAMLTLDFFKENGKCPTLQFKVRNTILKGYVRIAFLQPVDYNGIELYTVTKYTTHQRKVTDIQQKRNVTYNKINETLKSLLSC